MLSLREKLIQYYFLKSEIKKEIDPILDYWYEVYLGITYTERRKHGHPTLSSVHADSITAEWGFTFYGEYDSYEAIIPLEYICDSYKEKIDAHFVKIREDEERARRSEEETANKERKESRYKTYLALRKEFGE